MTRRQAAVQIIAAGITLCVLAGAVVRIRAAETRLARLEQRAAASQTTIQRLSDEARELRQIAGFTSVRGPGVVVTLRDSRRRLPGAEAETIIHDQDINAVVNELIAAGAEAVAVSGADPERLIRIGALTTARCAGPGMKVDTAILGGPYHIHAIGDPAALEGRLRLPRGIMVQTGLELLGMITVERRDNLVLPARAERPSYRFAQWDEVAVQ
jgi:uncharacterized protein YlxW (UPF0749 family)